MKLAISTLAVLIALTAAAGCSDDETASATATSSGAGGAGGDCNFDTMGGFGGFGDVCMDMTGDTECLTCTRGACCAELQVCETDPECSCLLACFLEGIDPICCLTECGSSDPVSELIGCVTPNCDVCTQ